MKMKTMLTVLAGAAIGATVIVVSCGGGGGGSGGGPSTTATGNVSSATAFLRPTFPKQTLLAKWKDMLFGTAYAAAAGVDVCVEGSAPALCTTTDGAGNFSLDLGALSGTICFDFSSGSLLGTICVPNVSQGATITMANVDCGDGVCAAHEVEVDDGNGDATPSPSGTPDVSGTPSEDDSVDDGVSEPDDDVSGVSETDDDNSGQSGDSGSSGGGSEPQDG
jgi:hypothetical protein